jgi:hypothetical protein
VKRGAIDAKVLLETVQDTTKKQKELTENPEATNLLSRQ